GCRCLGARRHDRGERDQGGGNQPGAGPNLSHEMDYAAGDRRLPGPILLRTTRAKHSKKIAFGCRLRIGEPLQEIAETNPDDPRPAWRVPADVDCRVERDLGSESDC